MTATKRTDSAGQSPREPVGPADSVDNTDLDAPGFLGAQDAVPPGVRRGPVWWARLKAAFTGPAVLFSLIWQVFLIYPILAVITADASTARTILGLVAIAAFSVIYLVGFSSPAVTIDFPLHLRRPGRRGAASGERDADGRDDEDVAAETDLIDRVGTELHNPDGPAPLGLGYLAALIVCALATIPAGGPEAAMTFLPFLSCFVSAAWPLRRSVPATLVLIGIGVVTAYALDELGALIPALIVVPVALSMAGTRISVGISVREVHFRRALGVVEERERVARDLHDVLGHTLTALTIRAQLAQAQLDSDPEAARRELANIEDLTRTALSEMRQTVSGMRVADPETELGHLSGALRSAGIDLVVVGSSSLVPDTHGELVAWTLREAGTNIVRHSGARHATVEFTGGGVRITDDGVGIDTRRADAATAGGQGLRGLADRAAAAGAHLTIHNRDADVDGDGDGEGDADAGGRAGTVLDLRWAR